MRLADRSLLVVAFVAVALVAAWSARTLGAGAVDSLGFSLGESDGLALNAELVELLESSDERLTAQVFLTAEARQPSERRGMQRTITALFEELHAALGERFTYGVVDPTGDADMAAFAAKRGVKPEVHVSTTGDAKTRTELYASIALDWGARGATQLTDLAPADLPHLQTLLRAKLSDLAEPATPHIVLLTPAATLPAPGADPLATRFGPLATALGAIATVETADPRAPDFDPAVLLRGELVLWLDPELGAGDLAPELELVVESGRPLVIAGSPFEAAPGMTELCARLGIALSSAPLAPRADEAPYVSSIAPDQDFRHLAGQPNGTLLFEAPAALTFDPVVLARRATSARRLASTRESATTPKQVLGALLEPADPRAAVTLVLAASTPFAELGAPGAAHVALVQTLLDSFISVDRRARLAALPTPPPTVPALSATQRNLLRLLVALPLPLALAVVLLRRRGPRSARPKAAPNPRRAIPAAVLVAVALIAAWLPRGPRLDWSDGQLNTPPAALFEIAAALPRDTPLTATLFASPPARLPASLATLPAELEALIAALDLNVELERVFPENLTTAERDALARDGVRAFPFQGPVGLSGSERRQGFMTLRLAHGQVTRDLAFESAFEREELAFRLGLALESFTQGRAPRVGFASDLPRLSAAEDYEYQSARSFAPREGDVFGRARRQLERAGFAVEHINPRDPQGPSLAPDLDALVWLQPRRDVRPMLGAFAEHLHAGGRALLAAQHFRTQARQYRGAGFELVFWPQPQLNDLDRFWLPEFGVNLVRRVRFDASQATLPLVYRTTGAADQPGAQTSFAPLVTRAPFLVRVPEAQLADHPALAGVGALDLADPSALAFDEQALAAAGLSATPLLFGSPQSWSLDWQGGWLPAEVLTPPATLEAPPLLGAELTGTFPAPVAPWGDGPAHPQPTQAQAPGRLALLGNSAVFTDQGLEHNPRGGAALLLGLVSDLALEAFGPRGPALAELAGRRPIDRSLGLVAPGTPAIARLSVIAGGALVVLLFVLARRVRQPRSPARARAAAPRATRRALPSRAWALTLAVGGLAAWGLASDAGPQRGTLTFGRFLPAELREQEVSAVRLTQRASERAWLYAHAGGQWRELLGIGAVGDPAAITKLVQDLFAAEGTVWTRFTGDAADYELSATTGWLLELYGAGADPTAEAPFLAVEVGRAVRGGQGALVRLVGDDAIWQVDRNPRFTLFGSLAERDLASAPPLADRRLVPRTWPLPTEALHTLAWQRAGAKSLRITRRVAEVSVEELQAGASPFVFDLIGSGVTETFAVPPPADLPQSTQKPDAVGVAIADFLRFATDTEYAELLHPDAASAWGLGPNTAAEAVVRYSWAPTEAFPEGLSFSLSIGPERAGSRAVVNGASGNLIRLDAQVVERLLPARESFRDPLQARHWR